MSDFVAYNLSGLRCRGEKTDETDTMRTGNQTDNLWQLTKNRLTKDEEALILGVRLYRAHVDL